MATSKNKAAPKGGKTPESPEQGLERAGVPAMVRSIEWMRVSNRRLARLTLVLAAVSTVLAIAVLGLVLTRPSPRYFAVTKDLRVIQLKALTAPVMTKSGLEQWVADTVRKTLTLDFTHWKDQLIAVEPRYNSAAFQQLTSSLNASGGILNLVRNNHMNALATITSTPSYVATGVVNGVRMWRVTAPVRVSLYQGGSSANSVSMTASVLIQRVPVSVRASGVRIRQIVFKSKD